MVSRGWAVQRIHECIVGWRYRCCATRNLGLRAIRLKTHRPGSAVRSHMDARQSGDADEWHRDIRDAVLVRFRSNSVRQVYTTAGTEAA